MVGTERWAVRTIKRGSRRCFPCVHLTILGFHRLTLALGDGDGPAVHPYQEIPTAGAEPMPLVLHSM